ncbi:MAG: tripartite tricarboxylate transporter substrate binding protein, partial [Burkholderiales bacterium]|nr:tripartite tricarboxylate transporter substrate binding protein [Burkholderiales bacterium]
WASAPVTAMSQGFPSKPIRLIVPFPPGGPTDILGRVLSKHLADGLGQPILVENRGGAGGTIAAEAAAKLPADGYTLFFGTTGTHGSAPALYPNLAYDPIKSFTPVSLLINAPLLVGVHGTVPAGTLKEFIALAKSQPGKLSYASGNLTGNIVGEMFKIQAGVDLLHVPYKGVAPAMTDFIAGRVQAMFDLYTAFGPFLASGKLKVFAVTLPTRFARLPEVPTAAEAGLPGFEFSIWFALFAPRGLTPAVLQRLNAEVVKSLASREVRDAFSKQGMEPSGSTPEELAALVAAEIPKWTRAVKQSGAKID